ncbi:CASP-like protein 1E2 [Diospyros lotus]|uniref:CASP-like protein 1E2 n=1 Tax=Diospyros lotus TaxID=55363 RepID=UPI00225C181C|nr:CASP-like protein 1E2 [Diospyros lotus]
MEKHESNINGGRRVLEGGEEKMAAAGTMIVEKKTIIRSAAAAAMALRALGMALSLAAAIVVGVDKQTVMVEVSVVDSLPPLHLPVTAKWHHLSAFVYFVVANGIACTYAALSLALTLATKGGRKGLASTIIILDLVMVALLFSGNGAAAAVGVIGFDGNSHVRWQKVCDKFGKFCHQFAAALALSLLGAMAFMWLVVLNALKLHKNN